VNGVPRRFAASALGFFSLRDLIPMFAVYSLLFAAHGLSTAQISSLFAIWSVTSFALEVPSGAWADTVSRRGLLGLSSLLYAAGFLLWTVAPSYAGFAAGFVLWGVSSALMSGTFQALLYDELGVLGATDAYPWLMGFANSLAMGCNLVATLAAAPLLVLGGYVLVGWVSVGIVLVQGVLVWSLPAAPRLASAAHGEASEGGFARRYVATLVAGLTEVLRRRVVGRGVLLSAGMYGVTAFDEFFPLLGLDKGADPGEIPLLVALTVLGQMAGTALAGRTARMRGSTMGGLLGLAAALLVVGALIGQPMAFVSIGLGYGLVSNGTVVAEARLQDVIDGRARATVTSVAGLLSEVVAVVIFGLFALGTTWLSVPVTLGMIFAILFGVAIATPRWLPPTRSPGDRL
jgi:MFS family permease